MKEKMLKPKSLLDLKKNQIYGIIAGVLILVFFIQINFGGRRATRIPGAGGEDDSFSPSGADEDGAQQRQQQQTPKEYPVHVHPVEQFVPAAAYSGLLKKPLEVVDGGTVSCPERGGKNTQCGKVSAEYRFKVKRPGDYFLYVQVIAPGLNDNSLWIGLVDGANEAAFDECSTPLGTSPGPFLPHKHLTSSKKFLCCPAYLNKNKKKGLAGFYSDCCYMGLGKEGNEKGCVLDLEVDDQPRWNQLPRVIQTTDDNQVVVVRIYAREDGTSWTGLVLSANVVHDDQSIARLKRSTA